MMSERPKEKSYDSDDPIETLRECQEEYRRIEQVSLGYRRQLYALYGVAYATVDALLADKSALRRFMEEDFVHNYIMRHRQNLASIEDDLQRIFRYVIVFIMLAIEEADRKKASKAASVLTLLHKRGVAPKDVAAIIEEGGGIEGILGDERRRKVQELVGEEDPFEPRPTNVREFVKAHGYDDEVVEDDDEEEDDEDEADETEVEAADDRPNEDAQEGSEQQSGNGRRDGRSLNPGAYLPEEADEYEDNGWDDDNEETGDDNPGVVSPQVDDPEFEMGMDIDPPHEEQLATVRLGGFARLIVKCTKVEPLKVGFSVTEVQVLTDG